MKCRLTVPVAASWRFIVDKMPWVAVEVRGVVPDPVSISVADACDMYPGSAVSPEESPLTGGTEFPCLPFATPLFSSACCSISSVLFSELS